MPAGYAGREGEIWFVRVLEPPHPVVPPGHIVFNTPYVIGDWPERAFVDYLERELARMKAKKTARDGRRARPSDEVRSGAQPLERVHPLRLFGSSA